MDKHPNSAHLGHRAIGTPYPSSKYMLYLPTEEELKCEIQHQRQLIEEGSKHDK